MVSCTQTIELHPSQVLQQFARDERVEKLGKSKIENTDYVGLFWPVMYTRDVCLFHQLLDEIID